MRPGKSIPSAFALLTAALLPAAVHAYGAAHVGYTHVGPNGVYHTGETVAHGPNGTAAHSSTGAYGAGGNAYHSESSAGRRYRGTCRRRNYGEHSSTEVPLTRRVTPARPTAERRTHSEAATATFGDDGSARPCWIVRRPWSRQAAVSLLWLLSPSWAVEFLGGEGLSSPASLAVARISGRGALHLARRRLHWVSCDVDQVVNPGLFAGLTVYNIAVPIVLVHGSHRPSPRGRGPARPACRACMPASPFGASSVLAAQKRDLNSRFRAA